MVVEHSRTEKNRLPCQCRFYLVVVVVVQHSYRSWCREPTAADTTFFLFFNSQALLVTLTRKQGKERDMADLHIVQGYHGAPMMKSE